MPLVTMKEGLFIVSDKPTEDMQCKLGLEAFTLADGACCTCRASRKLKNASSCTRFISNMKISLVTFIAIALLVRPPGFCEAAAKKLSNHELCRRGEYYEDFALKGGSKAGTYIKLHGAVRTFDECADLCCRDEDCKMALMLKHSCFRVDCRKGDPHLCERISAKRSRFNPKLFIRGEVEKPMKVAKSGSGLDRAILNGRKVSCHRYHGKVCKGYLDPSNFYYFTATSPSKYDRSLVDSFQIAKNQLSEKCQRYALYAICATWYPECPDPKHPKPARLCRRACEQLQDEYCQTEYDYEGELSYVRELLPVCDGLPDEEEDPTCLFLDDFSAEMPKERTTSQLGRHFSKNKSEATTDDEDTVPIDENPKNKTLLATLVTTQGPTITSRIGKTDSGEGLGNSDAGGGSGVTTHAASTAPTQKVMATMSSAILKPSRSDSLKKSLLALEGSGQVTTARPTLVTVAVTAEGETNLSEEDKRTAQKPTAATTLPKTPAIAPIQVSAGDNKELTLPDNHVSLYASTWPKQPKDVEYKYKWHKISAPKNSHGYMEGKDKSRLILTQLDVPGIYKFKVTVSTVDGSRHGDGFVNVTVKNAPRANHAPRAEIQPKEVTLQLPTNAAVLDGSKSTDDDKIVSYKWEEIKGPLNSHGKLVSNGAHKPLLRLRNLEAGTYTFRLTVTDSDGEEDHDDVTISVLPEKDYPPVARAGSDIVLQLPHNSATLYGNASTDDKPGLKYEWSKTPDSPAVGDMLGSTTPILKVSDLDVGDYSFVLKVTDSSGQTSKSKVSVIVRPGKNEAPKAVAGSDKDLVSPDDSTILDASKSKDDSKIVKYKWEKVSGPKSLQMTGENDPVLHLSKLVKGRYIFKLTVTDDKGLTDSDTVAVNIKESLNQHPVANAGADLVVKLPTRSAEVDGSKSTDDERIVSYEWTRDRKSPAAGDVLNHSDHKSILQLANLVEGVYTFELKVQDNRGLSSTDTVVLTVKEDSNSLFLVELYLDVDIFSFTEENKKQLLRRLSVLLNVDDKNVVLEQIRQAGYGNGIVLLFYVMDPILSTKMDGLVVANLLKKKVGYHGILFEYKMIRVEPYICRNNCSNHGYCDRTSKKCVCDSFWMENFFKARY